MRGIAELLFGRDTGRVLDLVLGDSREERDMADRVAAAGQWCASTPAAGPAEWRAGLSRAHARQRQLTTHHHR